MTEIHYQMIPLPYEMSSFHFYRWNQFKVIPLACTSVQETYPFLTATQDAGWHTADNAVITQSQRASNDPPLSHVTLGGVECRN